MRRSIVRVCWSVACSLALSTIPLGCGNGGGGSTVNPYADGGPDNAGTPNGNRAGVGQAGSPGSTSSVDLGQLKDAIRSVVEALNGMTNEYEGLAGSGQSSIQLKRTEEMYQRLSPLEDQLRDMGIPSAEEARGLKTNELATLLDAIKRAQIADLHLHRKYELNFVGTFTGFGSGGHEIGDGIAIARRYLDHAQRNLPAAEKLSLGPPPSIGGPPATNRSYGYLRGLGLNEQQYRPNGHRSADSESVPWRLQVDRATFPYQIPDEVLLDFDIPNIEDMASRFYSPIRVLYPEMPSVFVGLGANERTQQMRVVYSLEPRKRTGIIKGLQLNQSQIVALSPDGRYFAGNPEKTNVIGLFDVEKGSPIAQVAHEFGNLNEALMFAADNRLVLFNGKVAKVWSTPDLKLERTIEIGRESVRSFFTPGHTWALSPSGRYLAVPGTNVTSLDIMIYDLTTGEKAAMIDMSSERFISWPAIAFSPDGTKLAVLMDGSWDTGIQIWDVPSGRLLHSYTNKGSLSRAVDGNRDYQGPTVDWFPDNQRILLYGKGIFNTVTGVGEKLLTSSVKYRIGLLSSNQIGVVDDGKLTRFDLNEVASTPARWESKQIASEAMLADNPFQLTPATGKPVATVTDRSSLNYVSLKNDAGWSLPVETLQEPGLSSTRVKGFTSQNLYHFAVSADRSIAIGGYTNQAIRIWDGKAADLDKLKTWVEFAAVDGSQAPSKFNFPFPVGFHAVSPSGKLVATRDLEGFNRFDVWDLKAQKHLAGFYPYDQGRSDGGAPILWSDFLDDEHLFTMSEQQLTLWSVPDGKAVYECLMSGVDGVPVFSPDRKHLVLHENRGVTIISTESGKSVASNHELGLSGPVTAAAFSPNGKFIGILSEPTGGGELTVVETQTGALETTFPLPTRGTVLQFFNDDFVLVDGAFLVSVPKRAVAWVYHLSGLRIDAGASQQNWYLYQKQNGDPYELVHETLPTQQALLALTRAEPPIDMVLSPGGRIALDIQIPSPPGRSNFTDEVTAALSKRFSDYLITVDPSASLRLVVRGSQEKTGDGISLGRFGSMFSRDSDLDEERVTWTLSIMRGDETLWQQSTSANNTGSVNIEDGVTGDAAIQQAATQLQDRMWKTAADRLLSFPVPQYVFGPNGGKGLGASDLGK